MNKNIELIILIAIVSFCAIVLFLFFMMIPKINQNNSNIDKFCYEHGYNYGGFVGIHPYCSKGQGEENHLYPYVCDKGKNGFCLEEDLK